MPKILDTFKKFAGKAIGEATAKKINEALKPSGTAEGNGRLCCD